MVEPPVSSISRVQDIIEIVERKGIGHPDSIADGVAEAVSRALSKMYIECAGHILHHNVDKVQVVAGQSIAGFGNGEILAPATIIIGGRATSNLDGQQLPTEEVALAAAKEYIAKTCNHIDVEKDVRFEYRAGKGAASLRDIFATKLSNDTSFGIGHAPYSETERLVLETEEFINGPLKRILPETGQDVKVMAVRKVSGIDLTIAVAMIGKLIVDARRYDEVCERVKVEVLKLASTITKQKVSVEVNPERHNGIYYLTRAGFSWEQGDDGAVGRGNRCNGLITPNRPMSLEAVAGKNPVNHIGKLYNLLAFEVASKIYVELGIGVVVKLVGRIDEPVNQPTYSIDFDRDASEESIRRAEQILRKALSNIDELTGRVVQGQVRAF